MKNLELEKVIQQYTPVLYSYAYALVPDELQAEQIVIDAVSVFLMKEKNLLNSFDQELATKKERLHFKKTLSLNLTKEVWMLGKKRSSQLGPHFVNPNEYEAYYGLDLIQRSVLFLKDSQDFKWDEITFIHDSKKHQLLEKIYQAREALLEKRVETKKESEVHAR